MHDITRYILIGFLVLVVFYMATFAPGFFALMCLGGAVVWALNDNDKKKRNSR